MEEVCLKPGPAPRDTLGLELKSQGFKNSPLWALWPISPLLPGQAAQLILRDMSGMMSRVPHRELTWDLPPLL